MNLFSPLGDASACSREADLMTPIIVAIVSALVVTTFISIGGFMATKKRMSAPGLAGAPARAQ